MLLADARAEGRVLPACDGVVIDEAHNLEEVATSAYSHELKRESFLAFYRTGVQLQATLRDIVPEYIIQDLVLILDEIVKEAGQYFAQIEPFIRVHRSSDGTEPTTLFPHIPAQTSQGHTRRPQGMQF